jgi:hypothetical protein
MDVVLENKLQNLKESIEKKEFETVYSMPVWGEDQRAIPNDFARSALFTATKGGGGELIDNEKIFSQQGISLFYKGKRLTQDHLDIFCAVMHLHRSLPEGNDVIFTEHSLLKILGRSKGGNDHKRLTSLLTDLTATSLTIHYDTKGKIFWGSLLPEGAANPEKGTYRLQVSKTLAKFFNYGYVAIPQGKRKLLARSPLAKYLHSWLLSHQTPHPVTINYLHKISGSKAKNMKSFKQNLTNALDRLVEISVLEDWRYQDFNGLEKVFFVKPTGKSCA